MPQLGDFVIIPRDLGAPDPDFGTWESTNLHGLGTNEQFRGSDWQATQ